MNVFRIDPCIDPRWAELIRQHPRSSVFHTPEWLEALRRTYAHIPVVLTTAGPGEELRNGLVFCRMSSWLTGRRMVALPLSDHCDILVEGKHELEALLFGLEQEAANNGVKYVEIRPLNLAVLAPTHLSKSVDYLHHRLDLQASLAEIYSRLHRDCVQRKILRAKRASLLYTEGNSELLLTEFYRLLVLTRRRHRLPPQPLVWFRNLVECMGSALKIRIASAQNRAIAAILTLRHRETMIYKYGCSDAAYHSLGGMHLLLWRSMQGAREDGCKAFDLGRSDLLNSGLITFKDRWGAERSELTYYRTPSTKSTWKTGGMWALELTGRIAGRVLSSLPDRYLCATGAAIYRHLN